MTLKNAYLIVEEKAENISFKKETGKNLHFKGVSNWNKGFVMVRNCLKLELYSNDELIGQVGIDNDDYIFGLSVKPKYQKNGYGTKLMKKIEKYAKKNKLYLRPANKKLINFYEKLGYKTDHTDQYGLVMSKKI